ncbi:hypothetical protein B0H14DRAFT_3016454, partial [Mycena olivaceomarginata]
MPPADLFTAGSVASYRPPRTTFTPIPPDPPTSPLAGATAINRSGSLGRFPPPEPPVILPTAPDAPPDAIPPNSRANSGATLTARAGCTADELPFLNHAPPPVDSWIEVETTQGEYRTLATKKRRILHLRRISFGYDADLAQVRAEFDGEILRVIIPRKAMGMGW